MRLIDADALLDNLTMGPIHLGYREVEDIEEYVKKMPTIEERKTGRWLISEGACEPDYMECSRGKWITEYYGGLEEEWGYCPNCGARMVRGETDG